MDPLDPSQGADPLSAAFEPQVYDNQQHRYSFLQASTWPLLDMSNQHHQHAGASNLNMPGDSRRSNENATTAAAQRSLTIATSAAPALQNIGFGYAQAMNMATSNAEWQQFQMQATAQQSFLQNNNMQTSYGGSFGAPLQTSPINDFMTATTQAQLNNSLAFDSNTYYQPMTSAMEQPAMNNMAFAMDSFEQQFNGFPISSAEAATTSIAPSSIASQSPGEQWAEYSSPGRSDNGWTVVNLSSSHGSFEFTELPQNNISGVVSPQALHIRTDSSSSDQSEVPLSAHSYGSYDEIFPMTSPEPESSGESKQQNVTHGTHGNNEYHNMAMHPQVNTSFSQSQGVVVATSQSTSPASSGAASPSSKRRKSPTGVSAKVIGKKKNATGAKGDKSPTERRVGRRKGPLRPEQRQQAHEIRKVGACLRCKYLKKTCDKGDPCGGCQPSHHRLWQVPCTRIDIKDIGYFVKDWTADYERHVTLGFSIANIKGFSQIERRLMISHGYGFEFPLMAREVYVRDEKCFGVDWIETLHPKPIAFEVSTNKLSAGMGGVSNLVLSEYLDNYIDYGFEKYVDEYFEGTPFLTEMLKTAYRYWLKTNAPVIRKALKLVLAYTLTLHITTVKGLTEDEMQVGRINDPNSRWYGATCAPVMINFEIKKALAEMWRELMKDILEELSQLYSSVYSGEKLRHWPTIFMLASLLLAVWELMQFDCRYRVPDEAKVEKFCNDMESTPVGVIVGLFQAISTKLPSFTEWDTRKHAQMLNHNPAVCDAMTEVRQHVSKYEQYLKQRPEAKFDRNDFDSLSNKFLSKLVIRAGAS
ncbi:hypothetical protein NA57DRAFT_70017 [Rhizodiscina lignyota]|uniref:Zn(2)-C6 fungal-type domain-containing protein n=1 Tax=Rhizodiscina lignyota TaxID=1504668 RepID=A0A9P4IR27_9PEZI|nr:hypothetical protein NA57DRAFT_70017 [Rhizodiscina lignyota]